MVKIYFAGQDNFGNRGCEALIRSNVKTICEVIPGASFYVPSGNIDNDSKQYPEHNKLNVEFVRSEPMPSSIRWWSRARRLIPALSNFKPNYRVSEYTRQKIASSDAVLMTGGDIISLDYGLESLFYWQQICECGMALGKKTILWAGSVGPFTKLPAIERKMTVFLSKMDLITVRETSSLQYLEMLGLKNVKLVTDPAFVLGSESVELLPIFSQKKSVLGFNVSPLITKFRDTDEKKDELESEVIKFLSDVITKDNTNVLFIPHVDPLDGSSENSDSFYMNKILQTMHSNGYTSEQITILPKGYNAVQLKFVISNCTYFMGARTHATVAAISQCVPTTSIAYSIKAKGINKDLFGSLDYVLETPDLSRETLAVHFKRLCSNRSEITQFLTGKMPSWKARSGESARLLSRVLVG